MTLNASNDSFAPNSFGADVHAVSPSTSLIVLSDSEKRAMVAVAPALQGRVLTSTADGWGGRSYGWVNRELIVSGKVQEHFNAYGGEDRIWLGPEGGQYSIFFAPKASFDLEHWYTPAALDTEPFKVVRQSEKQVTLDSRFSVQNYSGTVFHLNLERTVRLLSKAEVLKLLDMRADSNIKIVAYESVNRLTNVGTNAWKKETGLLSLWVLGQFQASPSSTIVVPLQRGSIEQKGKELTTDYFGETPASRIQVKDHVAYFKADANFRSKIGVSPSRAKGLLGSYDAEHGVLTIVQYTEPRPGDEYVNSAWKIQEHPYQGDVANSYNDGPSTAGGTQLGKFYELESSSPAAALIPEKSIEHLHRTIHLQGTKEQLEPLVENIFGTPIDKIQSALP